jgi:hypothetical protein
MNVCAISNTFGCSRFAKLWHHECSSVVSFQLRANFSLRSAISAHWGERADAKHIRCALSRLVRFLAFRECDQIGTHLVLVRRAQAVRGALVDLQGCALDEL